MKTQNMNQNEHHSNQKKLLLALGLSAFAVFATFSMFECSNQQTQGTALPTNQREKLLTKQREKDPAIETALDELVRLDSYAKNGYDYYEYSRLLLNAKVNIDVAFEHTTDEPVKSRIRDALDGYVFVQRLWAITPDSKNTSVESERFSAHGLLSKAIGYAHTDEATRKQWQEEAEKEAAEDEKKLEASKAKEAAAKAAEEAKKQWCTIKHQFDVVLPNGQYGSVPAGEVVEVVSQQGSKITIRFGDNTIYVIPSSYAVY